MHVRDLVMGLATIVICGAASLPTFADFKILETFKGPAATPLLRTPTQKKFESQIRNQSMLQLTSQVITRLLNGVVVLPVSP
jgi:hypothetical protein